MAGVSLLNSPFCSTNPHRPPYTVKNSHSGLTSLQSKWRRDMPQFTAPSYSSSKLRLSPIVASVNKNPEFLKIMISGAPASGKGTQCELIIQKYGLVHIAAGDLLRAEVAAGSENGKRAKEYMEQGKLVPNEIVVMMVKDRLLQPDSQENGWLLDGYPRSSSQAKALEELGIHPDLFILLDVPQEILVERVVGRRLDPVTGKIYHLTYSPPENEEIAARLTQRFDDTEEKVKLRLQTHNQNVEDVLSIYKDVTIKINGSLPKEEVFSQIDSALSGLVEQKKTASVSVERDRGSEKLGTGIVIRRSAVLQWISSEPLGARIGSGSGSGNEKDHVTKDGTGTL